MRNQKFWLILLLALAVSLIWVIGVLADTIYLPAVIREATYTPTLTPTPMLTPTPVPTPEIYIDDIVNGDSTNDLNDEYIKIVNESDDAVNLNGWRISSERGNKFDIDFNFYLLEDRSVTVWSKSGFNTTSFIYMNATEPFWNNIGDCGYLKDDEDELLHVLCYGSATNRMFILRP